MSCASSWGSKGWESAGKGRGEERMTQKPQSSVIVSEITQPCFLGHCVHQQQGTKPCLFWGKEVLPLPKGSCLCLSTGYCQHDVVSKASGQEQFSLAYLRSTICQTAVFSRYLGYLHTRRQVCYYKRLKQTFWTSGYIASGRPRSGYKRVCLCWM